MFQPNNKFRRNLTNGSGIESVEIQEQIRRMDQGCVTRQSEGIKNKQDINIWPGR